MGKLGWLAKQNVSIYEAYCMGQEGDACISTPSVALSTKVWFLKQRLTRTRVDDIKLSLFSFSSFWHMRRRHSMYMYLVKISVEV